MGSIVSAVAGPILGTVGGIMGGNSAAGAANTAAERNYAAGQQARQDALFRPVGITNNFGSSTFGFDDSGKLSSAGYTLDPRLQSIQNNLFGQATSYNPQDIQQYAQPLLGGSQQLFNLASQLLPTGGLPSGSSSQAQALQQLYANAQQGLMPTSYQTGATPEAQAYAQQLQQTGQGYLAQSPDEARAEYMRTQQAALAPGQEQQLASLRNQQFQLGRSGLATGGTSAGDLQQSNPEMAAYYNSLANTNRQIAAGAENAAQQRQTLGLGMLGQGLNTQQQSEATQRANMLQNLQTSLGYGAQNFAVGTGSEQQQLANYYQQLGAGTGLFGSGASVLGQVPNLTTAGYSPLAQQLNLLTTTESMGQQPLTLGQSLGSAAASSGANAGQLNMAGVKAATPFQYQADSYNPWATALQGAGGALSSGGGAGQLGNWFSSMLGGTNKGVDINTMPTSNWASGNF